MRERYAAELEQLRAGDSWLSLAPAIPGSSPGGPTKRRSFDSAQDDSGEGNKQSSMPERKERAAMIQTVIYVINMLRILYAEGDESEE